MKWKPIETAPKDGTVIIACRWDYPDNTLSHWPRVVNWRIYHPDATGKACWRDREGRGYVYFSHWLSIPSNETQLGEGDAEIEAARK